MWNGGYEAKWLRKSGSLAWLGACETLGKRRKDLKLSSRSDQSWGPGGLKAKLENEAKMDPTSSKISSRELQNETKMDPKCSPKGALEASKRPLGAESGFRMLFGVILDPPKCPNMELRFDQQSSASLEVSFWLFGSLWGSLGARFGGHFGLHFGLPDASCHFCKK